MTSKKRAAMEMSVGTLVTIVLLMVVLVLGIVLVKSIFKSGTNAVQQIDAQVQDQINKLFADEATKFVVYPPSREISIAQGETGGVGFAIRNTESGTPKTFKYSVSTDANSIQKGCGINQADALNLIVVGGTGTYTLNSGNKMDVAALIKFSIPKSTPLCLIRYKIDVSCQGCVGGQNYGSTDFDLQVVS